MASSYEVREIDGDVYAVEADGGGKVVRAWGPLDGGFAVTDPDAVRRWLDDRDERWPDGEQGLVDGAYVTVTPSTADLAAQLNEG